MKTGFFCAALCLLLSVAPGAADAASKTLGGPVTGLWSNPSDGGRGFNIDIQGNVMIVTTYVYTQTGQPIWYLSSGPFDHKTSTFQSSYDSYSNGQCFGCPPKAPIPSPSAAGAMKIQFHDNQHATITTPSGPLEIQKFNYGFSDANEVLYGEWSFGMNVGGLYNGDWIVFSEPYTATDGTKYVAGRTDDRLQRIALGRWVSSSMGYLILVQSGSYYHAYQVFLDERRGGGQSWVYLTTGSPSGDGSPTWASRILYRGELGTAKNFAKTTLPSTDTRDEATFVSSGSEELVPAEIPPVLSSMRDELIRLAN